MVTIPTLLFFVPPLKPCSTAPPSDHHGSIQEKVSSNAQGLLASSVLTQQLGEAVPFSHSGLDLSKFLATKWMIHFRISHCLLCFSRKSFGKCLSLQMIFKSYFAKRKTFASCSPSTWGAEFRSHDRQSTQASPLPLKSLHSIRQSRYTLNYQRITQSEVGWLPQREVQNVGVWGKVQAWGGGVKKHISDKDMLKNKPKD